MADTSIVNGVTGTLSRPSGAVENRNPIFVCEICNKTYKTERGLRTHMGMVHVQPEEAGQRSRTQQAGKRWSEEELSLLARLDYGREAISNLNAFNGMKDIGSTRTQEAISRQRRNPAFKALRVKLFQKWDAAKAEALGDEGGENEESSSGRTSDDALAHVISVTDVLETFRGRGQPLPEDEIEIDQITVKAINGENIEADLENYFSKSMVPVLKKRKDQNTLERVAKPLNRKDRKKLKYKRLQELYKKSRRRAAEFVLDGDTSGAKKPYEIDGFNEYWANSLKPPVGETSSEGMIKRAVANSMEGVWAPISKGEVREALKAIPLDKAPGPDGIGIKYLRGKLDLVGKMVNLLLYNGRLVPSLKVSNTVFIPKKEDTEIPKDYRPISLASMVVRIFHKILAKRLLGVAGHDERQRGFRPVDGCAENIMLIDHVISEAKRRRSNLFLTNMDMNNAFGSVTHEALLTALNHSGGTPMFVSYVKDLYTNFRTRLWDGRSERMVVVERGILQGDPLSPILFNLVMDQLLKEIPEENGFPVEKDGPKLNGAAFADDLSGVTCSEVGMKSSLIRLDDASSHWGMSFNGAKCSYMALVAERSKTAKVETGFSFSLGGEPIKAVSGDESWRYLGAHFSSKGLNDVPDKLPLWLSRLKKSGLKPQQKLFILKTFLIPRLYFHLCMSKASGRKLEKLDRIIRTSITGKNGMLHLPGDTPKAFFHAPVADGGLGIPSLRTSIPSMIVRRFERLQDSEVPVIRAAARGYANSLRIERARKLLITEDDIVGLDRESIGKVHAAQLYKKVDGFALKTARRVKSVHAWVSDGTNSLTGREFCEAIKVRANAVPTRCRTARGRPEIDRLCRAGCHEKETLGHISQRCYRSYGARIRRHDKVASVLAKELVRLGYQVTVEPIIDTYEGFRKPDLIAVKEGKCFVIDPTITGVDDVNLAHRWKVRKYESNPDIRKYLVDKHGDLPIEFGSLTMSYRGIMSEESAKFLTDLCVTKQALKRAVEVCMRETAGVFRMFLYSCMRGSNHFVDRIKGHGIRAT